MGSPVSALRIILCPAKPDQSTAVRVRKYDVTNCWMINVITARRLGYFRDHDGLGEGERPGFVTPNRQSYRDETILRPSPPPGQRGRVLRERSSEGEPSGDRAVTER